MFAKCVGVGIILTSVFSWNGQASAGWVIEEMMKAGSVSSKQQVMLQANRMKPRISLHRSSELTHYVKLSIMGQSL